MHVLFVLTVCVFIPSSHPQASSQLKLCLKNILKRRIKPVILPVFTLLSVTSERQHQMAPKTETRAQTQLSVLRNLPFPQPWQVLSVDLFHPVSRESRSQGGSAVAVVLNRRPVRWSFLGGRCLFVLRTREGGVGSDFGGIVVVFVRGRRVWRRLLGYSVAAGVRLG